MKMLPDRQPHSITITIHKNISELDFLMPVIWRMRQFWPQSAVNVLYCCYNKKQILRECTFYSDLFKEFGVREFDYLDFVKTTETTNGLLRDLLSKSNWDSYQNRTTFFSKLFNKFRNKALSIVRRWVNHNLDFQHMKKNLDADIYFWPHRGQHYHPSEKVWSHLVCEDKLVVLYPHGAYYSAGSFKVPLPPDFREAKDGEIPPNHEIWYPHLADNVPESYPTNRAKFFFSGYPGLDTEWLEDIERRYSDRKQDGGRELLRCLFLIRKFQDSNDDDWIFETAEFAALCKKVSQGLQSCRRKIQLIVKPHPSNDYTRTRDLLDKIGCTDWEITYNPVYVETARCDLVISVPSTSNLIPALHGLPVVFLSGSVKKTFDRWVGMRILYPDWLQFYASTENDIPVKIKEAVDFVINNKPSGHIPVMPTDDVQHFRKAFPDGMLPRIEERMRYLYKEHIGTL